MTRIIARNTATDNPIIEYDGKRVEVPIPIIHHDMSRFKREHPGWEDYWVDGHIGYLNYLKAIHS
jgi:hypothetical protein